LEYRPAGSSMCLPLLIFPCTIKSRSSLLAPAHPGGSGKRVVKRLWCGGGGVLVTFTFLMANLLCAVEFSLCAGRLERSAELSFFAVLGLATHLQLACVDLSLDLKDPRLG